jgi:tyrosine-protein kinase Etk/Wzc
LTGLRDAARDELGNIDTDLRELEQAKAALDVEVAQINAKKTLRATDRRTLDELGSQIAVLDAQITNSSTRRDELTAELASAPESDRVLAGYERQLEQLQGQFDAATTRMAQSETDARLAALQQAERFTLLERAIVPEGPMGGGNKKLAIAGAMASLIAGLGLAFLLDLMNPVVRTSAQMERQLDLRPVVVIPEINIKKSRALAKGKGALKLLDDPTKPLLGMPRYIVISGAATLVLLSLATLA